MRRRQAPPALERHAGLTEPRRPAALLHAVVSLMTGVRPEEARAIGWEQDVDLEGAEVMDRLFGSTREWCRRHGLL